MMLKNLTNVAALMISIFMALIAALYISMEDTSFPREATHSLSLSTADSPLTKTQIVSGLSEQAASAPFLLYKVVAAEDDFYHGKSLYAFGADAPSSPQKISWFTQGMHGELIAADKLGTASLDGQYAFNGTNAALAALQTWLNQNNIRVQAIEKTATEVLAIALFNTGAWIPTIAIVLLVISLVSSWYVLRTKSRTWKVLNGSKTGAILTEEVIELFKTILPYLIAGMALAGLVHLVRGNGAHVLSALTLQATFLALTLALIAFTGVILSIFTWPAIETIAERLPPERHFRGITEALKIVCVLLVGITTPTAAHSLALSQELASHGTTWAQLAHQVSPRLRVTTEELEQTSTQLVDLAQRADEANELGFSYTFDPAADPSLVNGRYDGLILTNPHTLTLLSNASNEFVKTELDATPQAVQNFLEESYPLWVKPEYAQMLTTTFALYEGNGTTRLPGLLPQHGRVKTFEHPLVVVIERPAELFSSEFVAATTTSTNLFFGETWLLEHIPDYNLGDYVLSVDRIADAGLSEAQSQNETSTMQAISLGLQGFALLISVVVAAWVWVLYRSKRIFVQRTTGLSLAVILRHRMLWEIIPAIILALPIGFGLGFTPALCSASGYLLVSTLIHTLAARHSFRATSARHS